MKRYKSILTLSLALSLLALGALEGCKSGPPPLDENLSPSGFFQKAQEASDAGKYALATRYYEAFLVKYPDERDRGLWARYEIALLKYKMGDDDAALSLFDELIAMYVGGPPDLPQGPRILAEKLKAKIESKRQATPSQATPSQPTP
jgi:outer membrane protein assembly factor BamD (BamD/ComL family)